MHSILKIGFCLTASLCLNSAMAGLPTASAAPAAKHWVYSLSQTQQTSDTLKIWGVPACATVNGARPKGTYVTGLTGDGVGLALRLQPGDVLLSINSKVISSAPDADRILGAMKSGTLKAVVARQVGGKVILLQPQASYTNNQQSEQASATKVNSTVDVTANSRYEGNGMYSSHYNARGTAKKEALNGDGLSSLEAGMVNLINADRQKNGQSQLRHSSRLSKVAREFANDMATRGFFDHTDPNGRSPSDRARLAGIDCYVFENIAYHVGPLSWSDMVKGAEAEMMSEPANNPHNHRGNILRPDHQVVGVGVAVVMPNKIICVQEFSSDSIP